MSTAVFTIVSKNYLHYARTLMESVARVHPDWRRYVVLVDAPAALDEPFTVIPFDALGLPAPRRFAFRYTILELNTAVKPWAFQWLFDHDEATQVVYLDPDIQVFAPLAEVTRALDGGARMVLTPHLTAPLPSDGRRPSEHDILITGTYNLGLLALARTDASAFLSWWQGKLEFDCRVNFAENLFVDQRWMDLVPGLFGGVEILRDPGYNVAYWNLGHRPLARDGDRWTASGRPLAFCHFSGLRGSAGISVHQDRHALDELPAFAELARAYAQALERNGAARWRGEAYGFGTLADGTRIPDALRVCYRTSRAAQELAGDDPFAYHHAYANAPWSAGEPLVTELMRQVWSLRRDLQSAFPDPGAASRAGFVHAFLGSVASEEQIPERWLAPVRESLGRPARSVAPERGLADTITWAGVNLLPLSLVEWFARHKPEPLLKVWRLLGPDLRARLRGPMYRWFHLRRSGTAATVRPVAGPGLNIVGYLRSDHGVGESARLSAQAAAAAGLPFVVRDMPGEHLDERPLHGVNLLHVNADETPKVLDLMGTGILERINVGYWHWELEEFPDAWCAAAERLDEIWVPSLHVLEAVSAKVRCPVVRIPHAVAFEVEPGARRADFGLPEAAFVFLTQCDAASVLERKNPAGSIRAYLKAFPEPGRAALVVKISNGGAAEVGELRRLAAGRADVVFVDRVVTRQEMYQLLSLADALVSLHRAEGFGLAIAEAMYLSKPVIATGWSGNADFTTPENALIVSHELKALARDHGPYRRGARWAEPDLDHAARHMRELAASPQLAWAVGAAGARTIRERFSPRVVGQLYRERLAWLSVESRSRHAGFVSKA